MIKKPSVTDEHRKRLAQALFVRREQWDKDAGYDCEEIAQIALDYVENTMKAHGILLIPSDLSEHEPRAAIEEPVVLSQRERVIMHTLGTLFLQVPIAAIAWRAGFAWWLAAVLTFFIAFGIHLIARAIKDDPS